LLVISIMALMLSVEGFACIGMDTHNYYLFSVFNREKMGQSLFTERLDAFWKNYTNGLVDEWRWHDKEIYAYAQQKGDKDMVAYLDELKKYLDISDQMQETWDYPTKEQLAERKQTLQNMIVKADAHRNGKMGVQWRLLRMRANMVLGKHQDNLTYWHNVASQLSPSVYKDMMQNIYAGALMNTGNRIEACNEFARQGDMLSMKWGMRNYRNIAGIKTIYAENPNMAVLSYLVQDFVNNAQETLDSYTKDEKGEMIPVDDEWMRMVDARVASKQDVDEFIGFAQKVLKEKKTDSPALWKAAIGELQYLYGHHDEAMKTLDEAVKMAGTQRMKDNARAIRLVASVGSKRFQKSSYQKWVVEEMRWLVTKSKEDGGYYNHYREVMDRLIYTELSPRYEKMGDKNLANALLALYENDSVMWGEQSESMPDNSWNPNYSGYYYYELSELSADQLVDYYQWLKTKSKGELEAWAKQAVRMEDNYYLDLIGTRYMSEGKFDKAIDYLKNIPWSFLEGQNISYYMAHRDYSKPRWEGRQRFGKDVVTEGAHLATLSKNPKLDFCKDIVNMEAQLPVARQGVREDLAYKLATRYFQASVYGDCWYLTDYGWSSYIDTLSTKEQLFVDKTIEYLNISKQSTDMQMRLKSLYALAYIPVEPWCDEDYDWQTGATTYLPLRDNHQYKALNELDHFLSIHKNISTPNYVSKCDVLKQFRKTL
ncbi:MAG: hypothetical protein J6N73_06380, partial [Prevotella sp.]|nr:hypothetical protein [Prevotella sp.]